MEISKRKTCRYCKYQWFAIKDNPKVCPRCKRRLDFPRKLVIDLDNKTISGSTIVGEIKRVGLIRSSMNEGGEEE